ncbi:MAG: hypothetical protein ACO1RX_12940 [Candidatus Sericytochromatia bacterium]
MFVSALHTQPVLPSLQPRKEAQPSAVPVLVQQAGDQLIVASKSSTLKSKPLINLSPEVTGGVRRGGLSAGAVAGVATIGLIVGKISNHPGYLVATALGGPHFGMLAGGLSAKVTDNKWAGAAVGAVAGAAVYGAGFGLGSGMSARHTVAGVVTGAVLGGVSGFAAQTSGW